METNHGEIIETPEALELAKNYENAIAELSDKDISDSIRKGANVFLFTRDLVEGIISNTSAQIFAIILGSHRDAIGQPDHTVILTMLNEGDEQYTSAAYVTTGRIPETPTKLRASFSLSSDQTQIDINVKTAE